MKQDLFAVPVVIDTSTLHGTSVNSAPFLVLTGLVEAGLVNANVPFLALEEFRTQWRDRHKANADSAEKALKALSGPAVLSPNLKESASNLAMDIGEIDWEKRSQDFIHKYVISNSIKVIDITITQSVSAWKNYFCGKLPSNKIKHRADLPDAHIIAALAEFSSGKEEVLFVSHDKGQRDAAGQLSNVSCFESLDDILKSPKIEPLFSKWKIDQKWKVLQETLPFDDISEQVRDFVALNGGDLLSWVEVSDPAIPEDDNTALITMCGEAEEIELTGPEDWGGGLMRYEAVFFSECLLVWSMYKGDAYNVPEWVSIGGEVNDHYVEAEGYAVLIVTVDLTVRIKVDDDAAGPAGSITDISFENRSLDIKLQEFE